MNPHLTDEQLAACLAAPDDDAARSHMEQCSQCRSEAEELAALLGRFRNDVRAAAARQLTTRATLPHARAGLRWAAAAAALLVLAALLLISPAPEPPRMAVSTVDPDDVLLLEVQSDVQRHTPPALEPAALIVTERNLFALNATHVEGESR